VSVVGTQARQASAGEEDNAVTGAGSSAEAPASACAPTLIRPACGTAAARVTTCAALAGPPAAPPGEALAEGGREEARAAPAPLVFESAPGPPEAPAGSRGAAQSGPAAPGASPPGAEGRAADAVRNGTAGDGGPGQAAAQAPGPAPAQAPASAGEPGQAAGDAAEAARRQDEDERRKQRRRKRGRIRELEEIRAELAEKELVLIAKQQELLDKEQTLLVLREEVRATSLQHERGSDAGCLPRPCWACHCPGLWCAAAHAHAACGDRRTHGAPMTWGVKRCSWTSSGSCGRCSQRRRRRRRRRLRWPWACARAGQCCRNAEQCCFCCRLHGTASFSCCQHSAYPSRTPGRSTEVIRLSENKSQAAGQSYFLHCPVRCALQSLIYAGPLHTCMLTHPSLGFQGHRTGRAAAPHRAMLAGRSQLSLLHTWYEHETARN